MSELLVSAVDSSLRVAVLAGAVALVLALFRISSSSTRHTAWVAVIATMLLMPLLMRITPAVYFSVPGAVSPLVPPPVQTIDMPPMAVPESDKLSEQIPRSSAPPVEAPLSSPPTTAIPQVRWSTIAVAVYVFGAAFLLLRLMLGILHLYRIRRSSRAVAMPDVGSACESASVATPVTIGVLAPRVILPLAWRTWSTETLTAVLAHERAHAVRRDPLFALVARLNVAIFWFHPLAWWLERKVATLAEHAADDAALKHVARRRYAETLLDIAAMVGRHKGRLVWQGVGVDGNGRLGKRIDRVLSGRTPPEPSRSRQALVAASCAAVIAGVIACRQEGAKVPPLREDPELAAMLKADAERVAAYDAAKKMTAEQAAALEKALEQNPDDDASRAKLLAYYTWTGRDKQRTWNEVVAGHRRHALWVVEHRPESDLVGYVYVRKEADPEGHAQLRAKWLEHVSRADASAELLDNALSFSWHDPVLVEKMLFRAQALHPDGPQTRPESPYLQMPWMEQLGYLYADAIQSPSPETRAWGRGRLESSTNGKVLATAGYSLAMDRPNRGGDHRSYGASLIERAAKFDPGAAERYAELARTPAFSRDAMHFKVARMSEQERREALEKATAGQRLELLAALSDLEYMGGQSSDWAARQKPGHPAHPKDPKRENDRAAAKFAQSKAYAREALELSRSLTTAPEYPRSVFRAHIATGLNALRDGNRQEAVRQLEEASKVPAPPRELMTEQPSYIESWLVNYLLKYGERESVIQYLERSAPKRVSREREQMLKAAAAIREGVMPEEYQRLLADGRL